MNCFDNMIRSVLILAIISHVLSQSKEYRFDYEYSIPAGGWLKLHVVPGTWREARMRCDAEGAVLASPLTKQLKSAIIAFVAKQRNMVPTTIFTGVHASFSKGDYTSMEGVPLLRLSINWASGEPDNYNNAESCLAMVTDSNGSMSDVRCGDVLPYVCYKEDTHLTMTECGTTDPEYSLEPRTGSCYKFHVYGLPWQQAYMTCVAEGGHLIVIDTETEAIVVKEIYATHAHAETYSYWRNLLIIGFHDWHERTTFMTIFGMPLGMDFLKWFPGEPNNSTDTRLLDEGDFCGSVHRSGIELNDLHCNAQAPFICEKKPNSLLSQLII